jgi:hypothetical protein
VTISGKKLLNMKAEEMFDKLQPTKCARCGVSLHETTTGCRKVKGGCVCSDCYFKDLSEEVEKHPIGVPRMHRGG